MTMASRMLVSIILLPFNLLAQIAYTGGTYGQDFNSLSSGTIWQPQNALPDGWVVSRGSYVWTTVTNGYSNNYGTYCFSSSAADPDKSIGLVIGSTGAAYMGARFRNDTGATLTSFTLQYFVEQWAKGAVTASNQVIPFQYSLDATGLTTGSYSNAPALNIQSIHDGDGVFQALNGNEPFNRLLVSNTVAGIVWLPGQDLWIRWVGVSYPFNASHAMAIDDLSFSASAHPPAHPLDVWHVRHTVSGTSLNGVTFGNGLFVAVSAHGRIFTSREGKSWSERPAGISALLHKIAWGKGRFVAVGEGGAIFSSDDGTNWTARSSGVTARLQSICFGGGKFITAGESNTILSSDDGAEWTLHTAGPLIPSFITFGAGHFLIESRPGTNLVSTDGTNWFPRLSGSDAGLYTAGSSGSTLVAIDTRNRVFTSQDASNWVHTGSVALLRPAQIAHGNGYFVTGGGGSLEYSRDGSAWTSGASGYLYVTSDVTFGNGTFVAVGGGGIIKQSDPVIYLQSAGPATLQISGVIGATYRVQASNDLGSEEGWQTIETLFLLVSPDTWTAPAIGVGQRFYRVVLDPPPAE